MNPDAPRSSSKGWWPQPDVENAPVMQEAATLTGIEGRKYLLMLNGHPLAVAYVPDIADVERRFRDCPHVEVFAAMGNMLHIITKNAHK